jgi:hypothetical protein
MMKLKVMLYCLLGGAPMVVAGLAMGKLGWWWLSGITLAAAFVPVALFGPRKLLGQFGVIAPALLVVTVFCTASEAWIFAPAYREHAVRNIVGAAMTYLIVAAVLALLASALKLNVAPESSVQHRSIAATAAMVLLAGVSYLLYYFIFGAITYQFFTKGYYPEATQQAAQLGLWFWAIQIGRGVLMTLAILPVIYTLRMPRWQSAIAVGLLIWVAGGLAPLLLPNEFMGTTQRIIHIVEILTQNASLGVTAALLLRPKSPPVAAGARQTVSATS